MWAEIGKYAGMALGAFLSGGNPAGAAAGAAIGERLGEEAEGGERGGDAEEEIFSSLSTAIQGYAGGDSFGFGEGTSGIGPVADGGQYGRMLEATSGTSGVGPVADGDVYAEMIEGGSSPDTGSGIGKIDMSTFMKQIQGIPGQQAASNKSAELDIQRLVQALQGRSQLGNVSSSPIKIGEGV